MAGFEDPVWKRLRLEAEYRRYIGLLMGVPRNNGAALQQRARVAVLVARVLNLIY